MKYNNITKPASTPVLRKRSAEVALAIAESGSKEERLFFTVMLARIEQEIGRREAAELAEQKFVDNFCHRGTYFKN